MTSPSSAALTRFWCQDTCRVGLLHHGACLWDRGCGFLEFGRKTP